MRRRLLRDVYAAPLLFGERGVERLEVTFADHHCHAPGARGEPARDCAAHRRRSQDHPSVCGKRGQIYYSRKGNCTHDALNRLRVVNWASGQIDPAVTLAGNINHAPFGGPSGWQFWNQQTVSVGRDPKYRITTLQSSQTPAGAVAQDLTLTYNTANLVTVITDNTAALSESFGYDKLYRGIWGQIYLSRRVGCEFVNHCQSK